MDSSPVSPTPSALVKDAGLPVDPGLANDAGPAHDADAAPAGRTSAPPSFSRGRATAAAARPPSGGNAHRPVYGPVLADGVRVLVFLIALAIGAVSIGNAEDRPATVADTTAATSVASGDWGYPLVGLYSKGRGSGYNPVPGCGPCSKNHKGYDMVQACGATVYAAGTGVVTTAGSSGGLGNAVRIDHGEGLVTIYGHMQWDSLVVAVGQQVTAGVPLGAEGSTGVSTGCHLHYEVQKDGQPVSPEIFMASIGLPLL